LEARLAQERIASLSVDLGFEPKEFTDGLVDTQRSLAKFAAEVSAYFSKIEATIKKVGIGLTAGISAPFAAMSVASSRGAGGFEAAMNRVQAAIQGIRPDQLKQLADQARKLGPDVGKSAVDAADGIETLALAGMSAEGILGGGLDATLKLAAANLANLSDAGALVTDVLSQFGKTSSELPPIVDQITGALDSSKLAFIDFQQAIAQAGGVAGSAGVSFEDFNTAIAGTSTLFGSGSDAGTSFKTFITSLTPKSKEAAGVMKQLNIEFFDSAGKMKSLAEISEILAKSFGGLSERSRTEGLTKLFGTDAMRTAIGLMKLGKKGFEELQNTISKGDAGAKLAIQMQGYEASVNRLSAAFESLKISVGATGLLDLFTSFTTALAGLTQGLADANPTLLKIGVILWGVTAAIGPLSLALLGIAKIALPLFIMRLGLLGGTIAALINPIGALAALFIRLAVYFTGASSALTLFATSLGRILGPIGLLVTALTLVYLYGNKAAVANDGLRKSAEFAAKALALQREQTLGLAMATGEARKRLLEKITADRAAAAAALATARSDLLAAKASLIRAQGMANLNKERMKVAAGDPRLLPGAGPEVSRGIKEQAEADFRAAMQTTKDLTAVVEGYTQTLANAASQPDTPPQNVNFGDGDDAQKKTKDKDLAYRREQLVLQQQLDVATARGDLDQQRRIRDLLDLKQREQDYIDLGLKSEAAKSAAAKDMLDLKTADAEQNVKNVKINEEEFDLQLARIRSDEVMIELLERQADLRAIIARRQDEGKTLAEAEKSAAEDLLQLDAARLELKTRMIAEAQRERELELARLRDDPEHVIRRLSRAAEEDRRTRDYQDRFKLSEESARDRARIELSEEERAKLQGDFRDTFKSGVRAALEGDFKSFFKNWWTERLTKSLEDALNSVADLLFSLLKQGTSGLGGESGGGFLGSIGKAVGGLFGGSGTFGSGANADGTMSVAGGKSSLNLPKFATGGEFEVGGAAGIDSNIVSLRATRGEIINVRRPGDSRDEGNSYHFDLSGAVVTADLLEQMNQIGMVSAQAGAAGGAATVAYRQSRSLARR